MVFGAGLNDRINAIKHFTEALRISSSAKLNPARATPLLQELFQVAHENLDTTNKEKDIFGLQHTPLKQAIQGHSIRIKARLGKDIRASLMVLFYRTGHPREYEWVVMREQRSGLYVGIIPAKRTTQSIVYYIEAQDEAGQRVQGNGTAIKPNLITLKPDPMVASQPAPVKSSIFHGRRGPMDKLFTLAIMGGTGAGFLAGGTSENTAPQWIGSPAQVDIQPGFAIAPVHISPELGLQISEKWQLSILGRIQIMNMTTTPKYSYKLSILGEVRLKRLFGRDNWRYFVTFGIGAGEIRHRIPLGAYNGEYTKNSDLVDARVAGYIAAGGGAGLCFMFNQYFGWVLDVNGLLLFPNSFTANLDFNTGLIFTF
jgi:hypothetical protein